MMANDVAPKPDCEEGSPLARHRIHSTGLSPGGWGDGVTLGGQPLSGAHTASELGVGAARCATHPGVQTTPRNFIACKPQPASGQTQLYCVATQQTHRMEASRPATMLRG